LHAGWNVQLYERAPALEEIQEQGISRHEFRLQEAITRPVFEPPTPQPLKPSVSNT